MKIGIFVSSLPLKYAWIGCLMWIGLTMGCAVMSRDVQDKAMAPVPFNELIGRVDQYKGQTVILGGYVVSVENQKNQTRIVAVQTSLGMGQRPNSKDLSQGRLIMHYDGFLDPEVYKKDREITVAGRVLNSSANDPQPPYPYLEIALEEIHLWPLQRPVAPYPYWDDYWYPYPYPYPWYWRYPYWYHPYW